MTNISKCCARRTHHDISHTGPDFYWTTGTALATVRQSVKYWAGGGYNQEHNPPEWLESKRKADLFPLRKYELLLKAKAL